MIAKQLETILSNEAAKTDFCYRPPIDMVQRFQALRGYGLLPKGRGKDAQHLSVQQVVAGILSIVADKPGYAGLAAKILFKLQPVGGIGASFQQARNFGDALCMLLENPHSRDSVIEVRVSGSEIYTNGYGRAVIIYSADNEMRTSYFVGEHATSLMGVGAEEHFNPQDMISTIIKETTYLPRLFERIAREFLIKYPEHAFDHLIEPDEEEAERQQEERKRRLGITNGSKFLNVAVDTQVTWPMEEAVIEFDGYRIILMPKTNDNTTSLHIDLHGQKITQEDARTLLNRFLSVMVWCGDQFAILGDGWAGNPAPLAVPKPDLAFSTAYHWGFARNIPVAKEVKRALAIYREARNAHQNHMIPYAVLCYYKVVELKYKGRNEGKKWFRDNFTSLEKNYNLTEGIDRFYRECGSEKVEDYLWKACRCAVAHANEPYSTDADDVHELRRLYVVADILRAFARMFIRQELAVSENIIDGS